MARGFKSATILHDGSTVGGPSKNLSGRFGFAHNRASGLYQGDEITLSYALPDAALATSNYRPPANAADSALGFDNPNGAENAEAQIAFRSPVAISNYIGHVADGVNWLERLTSASKVFKIEVSAPNFVAMPPTGKQPYATKSSRLNENLNADMVDGKHAADFVFATKASVCDPSNRGMFRYVAGSAGAKDVLEICVKDSGDKFSWHQLY